ncbi:hypothetical protein BGZ63DRAFT_458299 [Mariannaea sp. PMI_226]|nr:hypothetical protein BGZ63DRAFT_458299 [Mariannaea sp. PMI_226]
MPAEPCTSRPASGSLSSNASSGLEQLPSISTGSSKSNKASNEDDDCAVDDSQDGEQESTDEKNNSGNNESAMPDSFFKNNANYNNNSMPKTSLITEGLKQRRKNNTPTTLVMPGVQNREAGGNSIGSVKAKNFIMKNLIHWDLKLGKEDIIFNPPGNGYNDRCW